MSMACDDIECVVFSNVPLGTWVAMEVLKAPGLRLRGVVCDPVSANFEHGLPFECVFDFASRFSIPILGLDDVEKLGSEHRQLLGLSVRFPHILKPPVIAAFSLGIINFHGGELPRYRGANIANYCILEGAERGGATLHFIDEGLDTGAIVHRELFPIDSTDTAYDLFLRTQSHLMIAFTALLRQLQSGNIPSIPQSELLRQGETARVYLKRGIDEYKRLRLDMSMDEIDRRVRAFDFPGRESAYFESANGRLYVRYHRHKESDEEVDKHS